MARSQISQNLQAARENAGWEQAAAAQELGVHVQTLSKYERGVIKKVPTDLLIAAATLYGVSFSQLTTGVIKKGDRLSRNVPRETKNHPASASHIDVPDWLVGRTEVLDRQLARAGATDSQLDYIKEVLRSQPTLRVVMFDDDGAPRSVEDQRLRLEDIIDGMRFWLERSPTPGGAPIAPVTATVDPTAKAVQANEGRRSR